MPFLGFIPIDPRVAADSDRGIPFVLEQLDSVAAKAFRVVEKNQDAVEGEKDL